MPSWYLANMRKVEILAYPAGQVLIDTVANTLSDVSGRAYYKKATASAIDNIEDTSGSLMPLRQRTLFYAGGFVLQQILPGITLSMADIGHNGPTRENVLAAIPLAILDVASLIPRWRALRENPFAFEAYTVGYLGALELMRNTYDQVKLRNGQERTYTIDVDKLINATRRVINVTKRVSRNLILRLPRRPL